MFPSHSSKHRTQAIVGIISRNVFTLVNGIIFIIVILLTIFGDAKDGIFLGLVVLLNIIIGCFQEIKAWLNLEKLQLLSAARIRRVNKDNTESIVFPEEIQKKDNIKLSLGDQVPCDGVLILSHGFGVSEALITGESATHLRNHGDEILAGSIVTSGSGILKVEKIFIESRISTMTKSIKKYSLILSPIQYSIYKIIQYAGYVLLLVILFVVIRGFAINETSLNIIQSIGALSSILLPQGMVVLVTFIFSYGAMYLYKRNVLLQEISATEKIGRIKNLCIDKTGTLTDNNLVIDHRHIPSGVNEKSVNESIAAYIKSDGGSSQTIVEIKKTLPREYLGTIIGDITFSSSKQFGAVHINDDFGERVILVGAPEIFLSSLSTEENRAWVQKYIDIEAKSGKRLICFVQSNINVLPKKISEIKLSPLALFVLTNNLRDGIVEAIQFFQNRGVIVRVISGDNLETVQAVSAASGIAKSNLAISGVEMESWTDLDFIEKTHKYNIFARVKPEQKERIIVALKNDGFTAMVGDGVNDALAIKKADLGIAMFDGAATTRQLASVILVKNSFIDLPNGVRLADSIIQNIEICASLFFNQIFLAFFFFIIITIGGYSFPFTALNVTFIDYFTIGLPVSIVFYWIIRPKKTNVVRLGQSFLKRTIPFALASAVFESFIMTFAFFSSLDFNETHGPTSLVVISFIIVGVIFFIYTASLYRGPATKIRKKGFFLMAIFEIVSIVILFAIPPVTIFYNLKTPPMIAVVELIPIMILYAFIQYYLTEWFSTIQLFKPHKI